MTSGADVIRERLEGNEKPADLVVLWARCHGLLDLAPTDDAWRLAGRLGGASGRVVLTADEEASYRRLMRAIPLARFLCRGG